MEKQNCLLIISRFPNPPHSGYKVKTFHLVKILSRLFNLHIVIVTDEKQEAENISFLQAHTKSYNVYCFSKWRCYLNALFTVLFSRKPLQAGYYNFTKVRDEVNKLIPMMDVVVPSLVRTTEYASSSHIQPGILRILDLVDSYALSYSRSKENTRSLLWKILYGIESKRLFRYERNQIKQFDATLLVNRSESEYWNAHGSCFCLPNGVHKHLFDYPKVESELHAIAFFGKMDYPPNVDAVKWFLNYVFERLDKDLEFYIVGISPSKEIYQLSQVNPRIHVMGFMDDPYSLLNRCKAIVSPMQTGGGIQNKVLETMALGKVNILSSLAADPIGATSGIHYYVTNEPDSFIQTVIDVVGDSPLRKEMGMAARRFVDENYSWDNYEQRLKTIIKELSLKK